MLMFTVKDLGLPMAKFLRLNEAISYALACEFSQLWVNDEVCFVIPSGASAEVVNRDVSEFCWDYFSLIGARNALGWDW